jgi:hypothetical protein
LLLLLLLLLLLPARPGLAIARQLSASIAGQPKRRKTSSRLPNSHAAPGAARCRAAAGRRGRQASSSSASAAKLSQSINEY